MHQQNRLREYLNLGVFVLVLGAFFLLNLVTKPPLILASERRAPAQLPAFTLRSVASGSFMARFEQYAADRFAFRESFRTLRAVTVFGLFLQSDKNGLYFGDAGAGEFKALDPVSVRQAAEKIRAAAEALGDCPIYFALVPDKSIYAGKYLPGFDLEATERLLTEALDGITYIPLADCLDAGCFYRSDLHWDQPAIEAVVARLCGAMGAEHDFSGYSLADAGAFSGVYAGQLALPIAPDRMRYLDAAQLQALVFNDTTLQFEERPVYDPARLLGVDPYDFFLQGPQAIVQLENPSAPEGELYLFRDSYGSSLAPLLACAYRSVTLIDLRYIDMRVLDQFVQIKPGADVLFIYSAQILNNPSVLRG